MKGKEMKIRKKTRIGENEKLYQERTEEKKLQMDMQEMKRGGGGGGKEDGSEEAPAAGSEGEGRLGRQEI